MKSVNYFIKILLNLVKTNWQKYYTTDMLCERGKRIDGWLKSHCCKLLRFIGSICQLIVVAVQFEVMFVGVIKGV